jgi:hypothetical protein
LKLKAAPTDDQLEHWGVITGEQEKLRAVIKEDTGKLRAVTTESH